MKIDENWLKAVQWNEQGLLPVITQDVDTHEVLMLAWVNEQALSKTLECGEAVYWSRSRQRLWHKGEESGHVQTLVEIRLDCDSDAILYKVKQKGLACHTGRRSCFFKAVQNENGKPHWVDVEPVIKNPNDIYHKHV